MNEDGIKVLARPRLVLTCFYFIFGLGHPSDLIFRNPIRVIWIIYCKIILIIPFVFASIILKYLYSYIFIKQIPRNLQHCFIHSLKTSGKMKVFRVRGVTELFSIFQKRVTYATASYFVLRMVANFLFLSVQNNTCTQQ